MARKSTDARQVITLQCNRLSRAQLLDHQKPAQPHYPHGIAKVL